MYFLLTSSYENQNLLVIHPSINPTRATRSKAYLCLSEWNWDRSSSFIVCPRPLPSWYLFIIIRCRVLAGMDIDRPHASILEPGHQTRNNDQYFLVK